MSYKEPQPLREVPISQTEDILRPGDSLGSFVGYLRRPKPTSQGMVAQFFGENGDDADVISALHLTRFLGAHVKVSVWMMKDRNGRVMKKDGDYPKLTEFIASVRRPQPSLTGQVAQFFGDNGANSDAINILSQSVYLDALVYVEMQQALPGMTTADVLTDQPVQALEQYSGRMTPTEAQDFKKLQKRAEDAIQSLRLSGFFRQEAVLSALGRPTEYQEWLSTQWCCQPGAEPCDRQPVTGWKVPSTGKYGFIPLCTHHLEQWEQGSVSLPDQSAPVAFAHTQSITSLQRWAMHALNKQLKIRPDHLPTPGAIYAWAVDKNVSNYVPNSFKAFLA